MFTIERHVGRLVEVRVNALRKVEDIARMGAAMRERVMEVPAEKRVVIAADYSQAEVFPPEVAAKLVETFSAFNPRIERSGVFGGVGGAISRLQFQRIVRESEFEARRIFTERGETIAFLAEALDEPERARLKTFLGG